MQVLGPDYSIELWTTDGTAEGTRFVREISPARATAGEGPWRVAGGLVFFAVDDGVVTHLLFRQDGRQQRGGSAHPTVRLSKGSVWILEHPSLDGGRVRRAVRLREGRT